MRRTIVVTGAGVAYVRPDSVRMDGEIEGKCKSYADAVEASVSSLKTLKKVVGDAGFDMDDLKTRGLSVFASYRKGDKGQVFDGFSYRHSITMSASADEAVGSLFEALIRCKSSPEFRVSFYVSDPSEARKQARADAVDDACGKARELASATGVKLGKIVNITYISDPCCIRPRLMSVECSDMTPEDEEFNESVTIEWEIQ